MLTLALVGMTVTHTWINQRNTLVKICRYNAVEYREVNDYKIMVNYSYSCPPTVNVKTNKK